MSLHASHPASYSDAEWEEPWFTCALGGCVVQDNEDAEAGQGTSGRSSPVPTMSQWWLFSGVLKLVRAPQGSTQSPGLSLVVVVIIIAAANAF